MVLSLRRACGFQLKITESDLQQSTRFMKVRTSLLPAAACMELLGKCDEVAVSPNSNQRDAWIGLATWCERSKASMRVEQRIGS
eukprot:2280393-Pleurochrysis_carterae.AAC.1